MSALTPAYVVIGLLSLACSAISASNGEAWMALSWMGNGFSWLSLALAKQAEISRKVPNT